MTRPKFGQDALSPQILMWMRRALPPAFLLLVGVFSARELAQLDLRELRASVQAVPAVTLIALQGLGLLATLGMVLYDGAMCRWLGIALPLRRLLRYSWVASTFNNLVGVSGLTGSGIRYLLLTREGVAPAMAATYSGIIMLSTSTGLATLTWALLLTGRETLQALPLPAGVAYLVLALMAIYLPVYIFLLGPGAAHRRLLKGLVPLSGARRLGLVAISVLDYALAMFTAWSCLWATGVLVSPIVFAAAFVLAAALGTLSMIPGALGVFDGILLLSLSSQGLPAASVLAGIVLYRLVYYLVPWIIGIYLGVGLLVAPDNAWLAGLARRWEESPLLGMLRVPLRLLFSLGVRVLSGLTLLAGVALLLSATFPTLAERAALLRAYVPLPAVEGSHVLSVMSGVLLIGLSRGIASQVATAYRLAMGLLIAGAVLSLLKGINVEIALFLLVVAGLLRLRKPDFYRIAYPLLSPRTVYWLLALLAAVAVYATLGALLHGRTTLDQTLLDHAGQDLATPRFLHSLLGALVATLAFLGWTLFRMPGPPLHLPSQAELDEARTFVERWGGNAFSHVLLMGDKYLFYCAGRRALIQLGVIRDRLVALGDPLGDPRAVEDAITAFRDFADRYDRVPVFHEVSDRYLHYYHDHGFSLFKLGEQARVPVAGFTLEGKRGQGLRHSMNRARRAGLRFEVLEHPLDEATWDTLKRISDAWLAHRATAEKGFSLGRFDRTYLSRSPIVVVKQGERIVAFANLVPGYGGKEQLTIDLMRHVSDMPYGTMDFLFVCLIELAQAQGYRYFSLGMAPLSGVGATRYARAGERLARLVYEYGDRFYNYKGLRSFKEKFYPEWRSAYLAYPLLTPVAPLLIDIAALISGGYRRILFKR